jgi:hypothetical protein
MLCTTKSVPIYGKGNEWHMAAVEMQNEGSFSKFVPDIII